MKIQVEAIFTVQLQGSEDGRCIAIMTVPKKIRASTLKSRFTTVVYNQCGGALRIAGDQGLSIFANRGEQSDTFKIYEELKNRIIEGHSPGVEVGDPTLQKWKEQYEASEDQKERAKLLATYGGDSSTVKTTDCCSNKEERGSAACSLATACERSQLLTVQAGGDAAVEESAFIMEEQDVELVRGAQQQQSAEEEDRAEEEAERARALEEEANLKLKEAERALGSLMECVETMLETCTLKLRREKWLATVEHRASEAALASVQAELQRAGEKSVAALAAMQSAGEAALALVQAELQRAREQSVALEAEHRLGLSGADAVRAEMVATTAELQLCKSRITTVDQELQRTKEALREALEVAVAGCDLRAEADLVHAAEVLALNGQLAHLLQQAIIVSKRVEALKTMVRRAREDEAAVKAAFAAFRELADSVLPEVQEARTRMAVLTVVLPNIQLVMAQFPRKADGSFVDDRDMIVAYDYLKNLTYNVFTDFTRPERITISTEAGRIGFHLEPTQWCAIGKVMKRRFKQAHNGADPDQHPQFVDGASRLVKSYFSTDRTLMHIVIREYMAALPAAAPVANNARQRR
jgi:hypothetical protein